MFVIMTRASIRPAASLSLACAADAGAHELKSAISAKVNPAFDIVKTDIRIDRTRVRRGLGQSFLAR